MKFSPPFGGENGYFSHFWFATVQEVLQADWHEA
jgi:hypothetical protein